MKQASSVSKWLAGPVVLAAALVSAPVAAAADNAAADSAAASNAKSASPEELQSLIARIFGDVPPLTAEQQAALPVASRIAAKLVPEGSYAKIMEGTYGDMMGRFSEMIGAGGMAELLAEETGLDEADIAALPQDQQMAAVRILDPAYSERQTALARVPLDAMTKVMNKIEPAYREGLARALTTRFSSAELSELEKMFSTPVGNRFASESVSLYADEQVMAAAQAAVPEMMKAFEGMTNDIVKLMENMPPERSYSELNTSERAELARQLGVSPAALQQAVEQAEAEGDEDVEVAVEAG